jgi:WD40 repeat protein
MPETNFKYYAFISYSHQDKKWGDWLHKALETYRVPKRLVGQASRDGETVPARVMPVFRDREELPTATDLGSVINLALEQSRYLIVICSPRSAKSQWVNEEILSYKRMSRSDRILAVIVEGEPNAASKPELGLEECFPDALKFKIDESGDLTDCQSEPIAADAREGKDGKANAKLKLLSGILGVGFDDLKQREQQRRQRRMAMVASAASVLTVAMAILAAWALVAQGEATQQRDEADRQRAEAVTQRAESERNAQEVKRRLNSFYTERGVQLLGEDDAERAIIYLSKAYESGSRTPGLLFSLREAFARFGAHEQTFFGHLDSVLRARFTPDDRRILTMSQDNTRRVWDAKSGRQLASSVSGGPVDRYSTTSEDGSRSIHVDRTRRVAELIQVSPGGQVHRRTLVEATVATLSPSGRYAMTGQLGRWKVWDLNDPDLSKPRYQFKGSVDQVVFSPKQSVVAIVSSLFMDKKRRDQLDLFDLVRMKNIASFTLQSSATVRFSDNGQTVLVFDEPYGKPKTISAIRATDGKLLKKWSASELDGVEEFKLSSDGKQIALRSNYVVRIERLGGEPVAPRVIKPGRDFTHRVIFHPQGKDLIIVSSKSVSRWEIKSGKRLYSDPGVGTASLTQVALSADGKRLATIARGGYIHVRSAETGALLATIARQGASITNVTFSSDGKRLVASLEDGRVMTWDWARAKPSGLAQELVSVSSTYPLGDFALLGEYAVRALIVTNVGAGKRLAQLCDLASGSVVRRWELSGVNQIVVAADPLLRRWASSQTISPTIGPEDVPADVRVWDIQKKSGPIRLPDVWRKGTIGVAEMAFSSDGRKLMTYEQPSNHNPRGAIKRWGVESLKQEAMFDDFKAPLVNVLFAPDGRSVVTLHSDKTVYFRRLGETDGAAKSHLLAFGIPHVGRYSPDGKRLYLGNLTGELVLISALDAKVLSRIQAHAGKINSIQLDAKSGRVLTAGDDGRARIWNSEDLSMFASMSLPRKTLPPGVFRPSNFDVSGRSFAFQMAKFSPDGAFVAVVTKDRDRAVVVWDSDQGRLLVTYAMPVIDGGIDNVQIAFNKETDRLVAMSRGGKMKSFDVGRAVPSPSEVAKWVQDHCRWRIRDGQLIPNK